MKKAKLLASSVLALLMCGSLASCAKVTYEAEFSWKGVKATATLIPSNGKEPIVLEADVDRSTTAATCEADGKTTYTATVEYEGNTYTDVKESTIEKLGHDYGDWVSNGNATHSKTCKNDPSHKVTDDCIYETIITSIPTSIKEGYGKIVCEGCNEKASEATLPILSDTRYSISQKGEEKQYEITLEGNVYSFVLISKAVPASEAQRMKTSYAFDATGAIRLDNKNAVEYAIYASEDVDVDLSIDCWSRGQAKTDISILDIYTVTANDNIVEKGNDTGVLPFDTWGSGWGYSAIAKVGKVHLNKGLNFIEVLSKTTNTAMFSNLVFDYSGDAKVTSLNTTMFDGVDAQNIQFPSTDGVATSGRNGITTGTTYLSKYTNGSNVRLNTTDYVEFTFEASEDVTVYVGLDVSFRFEISDDRSIYETIKFFLTESGKEQIEIKQDAANAYYQAVKCAAIYGEFHTLRVCELTLKAGVSYTLKLQARGNLHIETLMLAKEGNATIELLVE